MADDLDAALATVENPTGAADKTWLLCVYLPAAKALAAEVRRYQAMRCKTCKYSHWPGPGRMACKLYRCMITPDHGCLAWEKRDEA